MGPWLASITLCILNVQGIHDLVPDHLLGILWSRWI
jgi:hypothetical protein